MLYSDVISLISVDYGIDDRGYNTSIVTARNVFADVKSVRQSEFYDAQMSGIKLEYMFEIRDIDYQNEEFIEFSGRTYKIVRTYKKNVEFIEIVVTDSGSIVFNQNVNPPAPTFSVIPADGATGIGISDNFIITFDIPIDQGSFNASSVTLIKLSDGSVVDLSASWDIDSKIATCAHANLDPLSSYMLIIMISVKSVAGASIASNSTVFFTSGEVI